MVSDDVVAAFRIARHCESLVALRSLQKLTIIKSEKKSVQGGSKVYTIFVFAVTLL